MTDKSTCMFIIISDIINTSSFPAVEGYFGEEKIMKTKKILSALLAGACVFGMSAAMSSSVSAEEVIKVGVFLPLTGDNAAGGELELRGIKLANEQHSKVLGKKIQLVVQDNKSDKAEAANVVARLIEKDKVCAVVGTYGSSLAMAAGNILKENKIPCICGLDTRVITKLICKHPGLRGLIKIGGDENAFAGIRRNVSRNYLYARQRKPDRALYRCCRTHGSHKA